MQKFQFTTVSGGDWAEHMVGRVEDSKAPLADIDTGEIQVQVQSKGGSVVLGLSTADSSITRPAPGEFQWIVPASRMGGLCVGETYYVGSRHINEAGGITVLWTASLAYLNGGYEWR